MFRNKVRRKLKSCKVSRASPTSQYYRTSRRPAPVQPSHHSGGKNIGKNPLNAKQLPMNMTPSALGTQYQSLSFKV